VLMHREENREQGSRSLNDYLRWRIEKRLPVPEDALRKQIHAVKAN
jgi:hypothetical protein